MCTGTSFQTTRHKSTSQLFSIRFLLPLPLPLHLYSTISRPSRNRVKTAQKASSSKKLADASASNDRPNTEIRFILSFLWSVPFSFRRLGQRLTSFHGLYLSSRIISFVSLLRQPNDHFESAVYHTRGGGRGEEAQFNRGNRAIFPAIVPSFLLLAPPRSTIENPQPDRSNRERGRVIFASTWCNFTKFHDRISRFICKRGSFF